jgi:hypothetical protein
MLLSFLSYVVMYDPYAHEHIQHPMATESDSMRSRLPEILGRVIRVLKIAT